MLDSAMDIQGGMANHKPSANLSVIMSRVSPCTPHPVSLPYTSFKVQRRRASFRVRICDISTSWNISAIGRTREWESSISTATVDLSEETRARAQLLEWLMDIEWRRPSSCSQT